MAHGRMIRAPLGFPHCIVEPAVPCVGTFMSSTDFKSRNCGNSVAAAEWRHMSRDPTNWVAALDLTSQYFRGVSVLSSICLRWLAGHEATRAGRYQHLSQCEPDYVTD
jgi:hypothetical protein